MATGTSGYIDVTVMPQSVGKVRVYWREDYYVDGNYSTITITNIQGYLGHRSGWTVASVKMAVDGTTFYGASGSKWSFSANEDTTLRNVVLTSDLSTQFAAGESSPTSHRIYHDDDGTKTVTLTFTLADCYCNSVSFNGTDNQSTSVSVALTTIPRKSSLTVANGTLGTAQTLTITRKDSSFAHSIRYACGTSDVALVTKTTSTSISFTPPLTLAAQNTTGTSVSITLTLYTFASTADDATEIGRSTYTITCAIPDSVKPSCALSISDAKGYADTYGGYVQGQSKLEIIVTPTLAYDSPIASYNVTADGKTYGYSDIETPALSGSGTLTVSATVKDQRGRSGSTSESITVLPYSTPSISKLAVKRCDSDGGTNEMGAYCQVTYSFAITSLSSLNAKIIKLKYKKTSATSYTTVPLTSAYSATDATYIFAADEASSYNVVIELTDSFTTSSLSTSVSTSEVPMHLGSDGVSIAFGKLCEKTGFEFGKPLYTTANAEIGGGLSVKSGYIELNSNGTLADYGGYIDFHYNKTTADYTSRIIEDASGKLNLIAANGVRVNGTAISTLTLAEVRDYLYPVGTYYIANHTTSPASLFGGTWYRVQSRFLYGCAESSTVGETGGVSDVTLTVDQIPAHTHDFLRGRWYASDTWDNSSTVYGYTGGTTEKYRQTTTSAGGDGSHTNMPPYVNVAIWRRTA